MTFGDFFDAVLRTVNPDGTAENLVANNRKYTIDALIDLQTKVPRLQQNHTDYIFPQSTFFHCGASVFDAPRGFISSLTTFVPGLHCCAELAYLGCSKNEMDCMLTDGRCCGTVSQQPSGYYLEGDVFFVPYPELPLYCWQYPESSIDTLCRANEGFYTVHRCQIWMTPHLQSFEAAKLEWDGIKRTFDDADVLDEDRFDREVQECVELYVAGKAAALADCDYTRGILLNNENPSKFGMYQVRRAELIHTTEKERRLPPRNYCFDSCRNGGLFLPGIACCGSSVPSGPSGSGSPTVAANPQVFFGTGDPNGVVTAERPAVFYTDTGEMWFKTGAGLNNTGWELAL